MMASTAATSPLNRDQFVSVIVDLHDDGHLLEPFVSELVDVMNGAFAEFEVIFVDDDSRDDTHERIVDLLRRYERLRYLRLSRPFGREISVYAGMQCAIGDYVVTLSVRTDPPAIIPAMVARTMQLGGVVFGTCGRRLDETIGYRYARIAYVWIAVRLLGIPLSRDASRFMVFSRQTSNALLEIKDRYRHVRIFTAYVGYGQGSFEYVQVPRGGRVARQSFLQGVGTGLHIAFANSSLPLRAVTWLALFTAVTSLVLATGGWLTPTALPVQLAMMFVAVTIVQAVFAEYLATLSEGTRNRPLYYVREELNSSVLLADRGRRNLTE
jgi:glycosyltransferase involved in cell wall biosynthesis